MTDAWRTIVTDGQQHLSLSDGCLILTGTEETSIPISQIRDLVVLTPRASITLALLNTLAENGVNVLLCDTRLNPCATVQGFNLCTGNAGTIMDQANWETSAKETLWTLIIRQKIVNQITLLDKLGIAMDPLLPECLNALHPGDRTNREGQAARLYFNRLFGTDFRRHDPDATNAALNYGYTILLNMENRVLALHGYSMALGIHHCSRANPFNLSCDLIEPFRPFVDQIVYRNRGSELTPEYRRALIGILQERCRYKGRNEKIQQAMERFTMDVVKKMEDPEHGVGQVEFC